MNKEITGKEYQALTKPQSVSVVTANAVQGEDDKKYYKPGQG